MQGVGSAALVVFGGFLALAPYLVHRGVIPKVWAGIDTPAAGPLYWLWCVGMVVAGIVVAAIGAAGLIG